MTGPTAYISSFVQDCSFEEFLTFLLIYASHADLDFSESERFAIIERVGEATFNKVDRHYTALGEYQRLEVILRFKERFYPDQVEKNRVLQLIKGQFYQDGELSKLESNLLEFLTRLL